jgi:hypothetical protein
MVIYCPMENPNTSNSQLIIHSGIGVENYHLRDEGRFQVRYNARIKEFETLIGAYLFYQSLEIESSVWDMTDGAILVESKEFS